MGLLPQREATRSPCIALLLAAGTASCAPRVVYVRAAPIAPPVRTAAVDRAITGLAEEVLAHRLCPQLLGSYLPLPMPADPGAPQTSHRERAAGGRLYVERCSVTRSPGNLHVAVGGSGWRWIDRTQDGELGTRFTVQGYVRFAADLSFDASLALGVEPSSRRISIWLTPRATVGATVEPIGSVPVLAADTWSSIAGGLATFFDQNVLTRRANQSVREIGAFEFSHALQGGLTITYDPCTGQLDTALAPLAPGEAPVRPFASATPWLANAAVMLTPAGFDLVGPFPTDGHQVEVAITVPDGASVIVQPLCTDESQAWRATWLANAPLPQPDARARTMVGTSTTVFLSLGCPLVLAIERPSMPAVIRYRVVDPHARRPDFLGCAGR